MVQAWTNQLTHMAHYIIEVDQVWISQPIDMDQSIINWCQSGQINNIYRSCHNEMVQVWTNQPIYMDQSIIERYNCGLIRNRRQRKFEQRENIRCHQLRMLKMILNYIIYLSKLAKIVKVTTKNILKNGL